MNYSWISVTQALRSTMTRGFLIVEGIYFGCAAAYVTVFGTQVIQSDAGDHGFLAATSLPLVAAGALSLWGLALMVILRFTSIEGYTARFGSKYRASICAVLVVAAMHFGLGFAFHSAGQALLGNSVIMLGLLLGASVFLQRKWMSRTLSSRNHLRGPVRAGSLA